MNENECNVVLRKIGGGGGLSILKFGRKKRQNSNCDSKPIKRCYFRNKRNGTDIVPIQNDEHD